MAINFRQRLALCTSRSTGSAIVTITFLGCSAILGIKDIPDPIDSNRDSGVEAGILIDAAPSPPDKPSSLSFRDQNPAEGLVRGLVIIGKAVEERDIQLYRLYWGSDSTPKMSKIIDLVPTGKDVTYALESVVPQGATHLLAISVKGQEVAEGAVLTSFDNFASYANILAGQGDDGGSNPSLVIDTVNSKILVATTNRNNDKKPSLFRCNLDGSQCLHIDISAGQGAESGYEPSAQIDIINNKILVVAQNGANSDRLGLFRCNLDGSNCSHTDISAGQPIRAQSPCARIDAANAKLLVASTDAVEHKLHLFRCNLDGSSCLYTDISAGQAANTGTSPSAQIDAKNSKFLVVTMNRANDSKLSLFRCNLDGSECKHTDISTGQGSDSGTSPATLIDPINNKLLVVTSNGSTFGRLSLFRCSLDGSTCTHKDISAGKGDLSGQSPSAAIDLTNQKLFVATYDTSIPGGNSAKLGLFRCELDGNDCMYVDVAAGQGVNTGYDPSSAIDPATHRLFIAARGGLGLFSIGTW